MNPEQNVFVRIVKKTNTYSKQVESAFSPYAGGYSGQQWAAAPGREPDLHHAIQRQQRWRSAASSATASRLFKRRRSRGQS